MELKKITRPVLLLNEELCRRNIKTMTSKAANGGIAFRPHFKTHQSLEVGKWFREAGVSRITVSSLLMCRHFMNDGWDDITIAFPANPREVDEYVAASRKINLNLLFSDYEQLVKFSEGFDGEAGVYIKIDTGYRRSGVDWNHYTDILRICDYIDETRSLRKEGLLTHSGHTYSVKGINSVLEIFCDTRHKLHHTREIIPSGNDLKISIGDTPTCSMVNDFTGIDEIRPGNFVFYDLMQLNIGSCGMDDIAIALAAPVVSVARHRKEAVIYGGAVHLSKEYIIDESGRKVFGKVFRLTPEGWDVSESIGYIGAVSQEHGILFPEENSECRVKPGDIVAVLPAHSCLTSDLMGSYLTLEGRVLNDLCGKR